MEQSKYRLSEHPRFGLLMERKLGDGIVTRTAKGVLIAYETSVRAPMKRLVVFRKKMAQLQIGEAGQ
jgi:hypothetical protein